MNIFATSDDPVEAALWLDDLRLRKMIVESAQMLSTAVYAHTGKLHSSLYKPAYPKHPCTLWAGQSQKNFLWLYEHAMAMVAFYEQQWGKEHASHSTLSKCYKFRKELPRGKLTEFVNCTEFKMLKLPIVKIYQTQMNHKWNHDIRPPLWTNRPIPPWRHRLDA